jgi:protein TonB
MSPERPIFTALVVSRPAVPLRHLSRVVVMALVAAGYLAGAGALFLLQLLFIETMPPPKAATGPVIIFHPPSPGGSGGAGERRGGPPVPPPVTPPVIHPPAPLPTVVPLAPPADDRSEDPATSATPGANSTGPTGEGPGGEGAGRGITSGTGSGESGGCPTCPPGATQRRSDADIHPDGAPGILPPVVIPSTRALPKYPDLARRALIQGSVILLVVIGADGRVGEIQVVSSPDPRFGFDLAAVEAVKQWRYRPAMLGRRPVAVQASVIVEFSLSH